MKSTISRFVLKATNGFADIFRKKATSVRALLLSMALAIVSILSFTGCRDNGTTVDVYFSPVVADIVLSPCAKFERKSDESKLLITGDIFTLSSAFSSLELIRIDEPEGASLSDWLYRITFNCNELSPSSEEIIALVCESSLWLNGSFYTTREGVPFEAVIELFESKFHYFSTVFSTM